MKCKKCGTIIPDGKFYCPRCGLEVQIVPDYNGEEDLLTSIVTGQEEDTQEKQEKEKNSVSQEEPEVSSDDFHSSYFSSERDSSEKTALKKKSAEKTASGKKSADKISSGRKKKRLLISALIFAFLLLIVVIYFIAAAENRYRKERQQYNSYDYQLSQGQSAEADGNYEEALAFYSRALELDHFDLDVRFLIAGVYEKEEETENAEEMYLEIIDQDTDNKEAYENLIRLYEKDGNIEAITELSVKSNVEDIKSLFIPFETAEPVFSLQEGVYQRYLKIELQSQDASEIFYTVDGSDPKEKGLAYKEPLELDEEGTYVIRAVCRNMKNIYSSVVSATYTIEIPAPDTPVVSPSGGDFATDTKIYIDIPENCTAYYTWDSSDPTADSSCYDGNLWIPEGNNVLSVILINNVTGKASPVFRTHYTYYADSSETMETE